MDKLLTESEMDAIESMFSSEREYDWPPADDSIDLPMDDGEYDRG